MTFCFALAMMNVHITLVRETAQPALSRDEREQSARQGACAAVCARVNVSPADEDATFELIDLEGFDRDSLEFMQQG